MNWKEIAKPRLGLLSFKDQIELADATIQYSFGLINYELLIVCANIIFDRYNKTRG